MSTEDSRPDQLPKDPTEVDVGCEISSKLCRAYLRGIHSSESLKYAPRHPTKNFAQSENTQTLGEERDENKRCYGH